MTITKTTNDVVEASHDERFLAALKREEKRLRDRSHSLYSNQSEAYQDSVWTIVAMYAQIDVLRARIVQKQKDDSA